MERDSFKTQLKLHLVIYLALAVLIYGVFAYFFSPQAKLINTRQDKAINILALTNPPFFISYNPQGKKALVT
ncbi:MAG: hypothetical protein LBM71_02835, partial [Elusimicrobiota bacterium]|nr:hypothetical protein [Elusimicrobiota bacterium]